MAVRGLERSFCDRSRVTADELIRRYDLMEKGIQNLDDDDDAVGLGTNVPLSFFVVSVPVIHVGKWILGGYTHVPNYRLVRSTSMDRK
jgi:hypothetical protein